MKTPDELKYTRDHEWVRVDGAQAIIGITDYAQEQLGDIVLVDLPKVGRTLEAHETFGTVESVKSVSDIFSPVAGKVVAVNEHLGNAPETVNADPYDKGWMIRVQLADPGAIAALMSAADYQKFVAQSAH